MFQLESVGGGSTQNQICLVGSLSEQGQFLTAKNISPVGLTNSDVVRFKGPAVIEDSLTGNQLSVIAASAMSPITEAAGADLTSGGIRSTVGGNPITN